MTLQVVNLGLPKSGTTTLAEALRLGGLTVADHRFGRKDLPHPSLRRVFVAEALYRGYFRTGNPAAYLPSIDAITEMSMLRDGASLWPQMDLALLSALKTHNPDVRFVASYRDPEAMSRSMLAWSNLGTARLPNACIPGLPEGYGQTSKERVQWIEGHYATLRTVFSGRDDYLEFDVADPNTRETLAGFLDRDLPWWGRLNTNPLLDEQRA